MTNVDGRKRSATALGDYSNALGTGAYGARQRRVRARRIRDRQRLQRRRDRRRQHRDGLRQRCQRRGERRARCARQRVGRQRDRAGCGLGGRSREHRCRSAAIGLERQLTHVADGSEDFDAVNVRQLRAAGLVDIDGNDAARGDVRRR